MFFKVIFKHVVAAVATIFECPTLLRDVTKKVSLVLAFCILEPAVCIACSF